MSPARAGGVSFSWLQKSKGIMKHTALTSMKFLRLKRRLALPSWQVAGILEMLWAFAGTNAQDGGIGRFHDDDLAAWMEWAGDAKELIESLVDCGWIDPHPEFRLMIHDWEDHCPRWIKGAQARHGKHPAKHAAKQLAKEPAKHAAKHPTSLPNLTIPNLTQPKTEDVCPETDQPSSGPTPQTKHPAVLCFPTDGPVHYWDLTQPQIDDWAQSFPKLDVLSECRKALAWIQASPERKKTAKGMPRFLVAWLGRSNDRSPGPGFYPQKPSAIEEAQKVTERMRADGVADRTISRLMADLGSTRPGTQPEIFPALGEPRRVS